MPSSIPDPPPPSLPGVAAPGHTTTPPPPSAALPRPPSAAAPSSSTPTGPSSSTSAAANSSSHVSGVISRSSFLASSVVGMLYSNDSFRDAVLTQTELSQMEPDLRILFDSFGEMNMHTINRPPADILSNLQRFDSLVSCFEHFIATVHDKVPHAPSTGFENVDQEKAMKDIMEARNDLAEAIRFKAETKASCQCTDNSSSKTLSYFESFITVSDENLMQSWNEFADKAGAELQKQAQILGTCKECNAIFKTADSELSTPNFPLLLTNKCTEPLKSISLSNSTFTLKCAILFSSKFGDYEYITRVGEKYVLVRRAGFTSLTDGRLKEIFKDQGNQLKAVLLEKVPTGLDHDTIKFMKQLKNPPGRFQNETGVCMILALTNTLLSLPEELRETLKAVEVPNGGRPSGNALLWRLIAPSESIAKAQAEKDWNIPSAYPPETLYRLALGGVLGIAEANKGAQSRLSTSDGVHGVRAFKALFDRLKGVRAFDTIASVRFEDDAEELEEEWLEKKRLNLVYFSADTTPKCKVSDVLLVRPQRSTLFFFVAEPGHTSLMIQFSTNEVLLIDNSDISYKPELTAELKSYEVNVVICVRLKHGQNEFKGTRIHRPIIAPSGISPSRSLRLAEALHTNSTQISSDERRTQRTDSETGHLERTQSATPCSPPSIDMDSFLHNGFADLNEDEDGRGRPSGDGEGGGPPRRVENRQESSSSDISMIDIDDHHAADASDRSSSPSSDDAIDAGDGPPSPPGTTRVIVSGSTFYVERGRMSIGIWTRKLLTAYVLRRKGKYFYCVRQLQGGRWGRNCRKGSLKENASDEETAQFAARHMACIVNQKSKNVKIGSSTYKARRQENKQWIADHPDNRGRGDAGDAEAMDDEDEQGSVEDEEMDGEEGFVQDENDEELI